jgi:hypothetical protein
MHGGWCNREMTVDIAQARASARTATSVGRLAWLERGTAADAFVSGERQPQVKSDSKSLSPGM